MTIIETCINCGIQFSVPADWHNQRREDHKDFWCPNGHKMHYSAESEKEKLRRERNQLKQEIARIEDEAREERNKLIHARDEAKRSAAAQKGQVTKLKRRAASGACPCCNRTFQNLARHMKTKHPKFVEDKKPKELAA